MPGGGSENKPFCDGTHAHTGFTEVRKVVGVFWRRLAAIHHYLTQSIVTWHFAWQVVGISTITQIGLDEMAPCCFDLGQRRSRGIIEIPEMRSRVVDRQEGRRPAGAHFAEDRNCSAELSAMMATHRMPPCSP
jgi:hypothetical protein